MSSRKPQKPVPRFAEETAPDPARSYERAKPEAEAGMGRLDTDPTPLSKKPDRIEHAVGNKQASRQINADDVMNDSEKPARGESAINAPKRPAEKRAHK